MGDGCGDMERLIREGLPDARVSIEDCGRRRHYAAPCRIRRLPRQDAGQQHKMVYQALKGRLGNEIQPLTCRRACARTRIS